MSQLYGSLDSEVRLVADHPGRETQHTEMPELETIAPVHVIPLRERVDMPRPVHLDNQPGRSPAPRRATSGVPARRAGLPLAGSG